MKHREQTLRRPDDALKTKCVPNSERLSRVKSETALIELEKQMQQAVLKSASLRRQRKAIRAGMVAVNSKQVSLAQDGDAIMFEGNVYNLYYANGGLQIDRAFKVAIRKKGYTTDERHAIFAQIKKLVVESTLASSNIYGSPSAGQIAINEQGSGTLHSLNSNAKPKSE